MFEHFTTPEEIFSYKLGSALTMEYDSLEMLEYMEKKAMRSELREIFREHAHETRQQIENLKRCFASLGQEVNQMPSPATKGLAKDAKSFIVKTDEILVDAVVLAALLEAEHHEMAVYENLITQAKALGAAGTVELLSKNLLQEQSALEKIKTAANWIVQANAEDRARTDPAPEPEVGAPPYLPPGAI
ncbi:hypothetical protein ART_0328 [Arthrobacter sp. PAMC 25486]|uniref:ferritin-like domain-containing protein n=1 Tax=Arthrobacter sp. PAMC 25486 TaxID=1494608 RepID=UPI000535C2A3|nr:ferritin-like domain-containing protein [Arthrobacter sp. PAMC 25486]AIX99926.1 hypothetical protein ART_0328 [Arthrobacter sp. PAMC 25486]